VSPDDVVGAATAEASPQAPVLRTEGPLELVEWSAIGELLGGEYAAAYLNTRRWSGARAATLRNVRAECVVALPHEPRAAVAVVVAEAGVATVRYQLPLVRLPHPAPPAAGAPLALVVSGADEEGIYDGALAPAFHRALRALIVEAGRAGGASAELRGEALAPATDLPDDASSAVIGGEQSNTSIVYGDGSIIKLFRRVEVGDNPDVEIGRVLAARSDASTVPRLLGTLRYVDAGGGVATLAMRQQLVAGARDAWAYTLDTARHDTDSARAGWDRTLAAARDMNDPLVEGQILRDRAVRLASVPPVNWDALLADLERAEMLFEQIGVRPQLARLLADRARVLDAAGRPAEATEARARAYALAAELGIEVGQASAPAND